MNREVFLIGTIVLLVGILFMQMGDNVRAINVANYVINSWNDNQQQLINICGIDYNQYMKQQTYNRLRDLNFVLQNGYDINLGK